MKKVMIAMIALVSVVILGLATVLVLGLTGVTDNFSFFGGVAEAKLANRQTFKSSELDSIDMRYRSISIELLPSSGDEVVLEEYYSKWNEDMLAEIRQEGDSLSIRQGEGFKGLLWFWRAEAKLYLPQSWAGALQLETSSGSIRTEEDWSLASLQASSSSGSVRLKDIEASGDVSIGSTSGGVSFDEVATEGNAQFGTSSGSMHLGRVSARRVDADTTSGSLHIDEVKADTVEAGSSSGSLKIGRLEGEFRLESTSGSLEVERGIGHGTASTSSGSLRVTLDEMDGDIRAESTSGSLRLALPRTAGFRFSGTTNSGSLKTEFDEQLSYSRDGHEAKGNYGEATPQYDVDCSTSSGSLRVEWS